MSAKSVNKLWFDLWILSKLSNNDFAGGADSSLVLGVILVLIPTRMAMSAKVCVLPCPYLDAC